MKNSNIILYSPGAYGHFINWCCDYFSGNLNSSDIPLDELGSCHQYKQAIILSDPPDFKNYTESQDDFKFVQLHEHSIDLEDLVNFETHQCKINETIEKNLNYLTINYHKIIYIYPTETSKIWIQNNCLYKRKLPDNEIDNFLLRAKSYEFFTSNRINDFLAYGNDRLKLQIKQNINLLSNYNKEFNEFAEWEFRELISTFCYDLINKAVRPTNLIEKLNNKFPNVYFIKLDDLRDNFNNTIINILDYFNIIPNYRLDQLDNIHRSWINKQLHINKDQQLDQIVNALVNNINLDWQNWQLTFIDEAIIQQKLIDQGLSIKCWNLNIFPTNTQDFIPLLERM